MDKKGVCTSCGSSGLLGLGFRVQGLGLIENLNLFTMLWVYSECEWGFLITAIFEKFLHSNPAFENMASFGPRITVGLRCTAVSQKFEYPRPLISKLLSLNRYSNRDPKIKALKRRGVTNHGLIIFYMAASTGEPAFSFATVLLTNEFWALP